MEPRECVLCLRKDPDPTPWVMSGLSVVWFTCPGCVSTAMYAVSIGKREPWELSKSAMGPRRA